MKKKYTKLKRRFNRSCILIQSGCEEEKIMTFFSQIKEKNNFTFKNMVN
jgi:hypothetical protein